MQTIEEAVCYPDVLTLTEQDVPEIGISVPVAEFHEDVAFDDRGPDA